MRPDSFRVVHPASQRFRDIFFEKPQRVKHQLVTFQSSFCKFEPRVAGRCIDEPVFETDIIRIQNLRAA